MKGFNRPYVRDFFNIFQPIYFPGENYSFYVNIEDLIDDVDVSMFQLWILNPDGSQNTMVCMLDNLNIPGTAGYVIYKSDFIFPYINAGNYSFQVFNSITFTEVFRSNAIKCAYSEDALYRTSYVKYRHNDILYGIRYDLLPDFYQKFRLPINQIKAPEVRSERTQYRQSSNGRELRNSKSFRDIVLTMELYWASDEDIEALSAMLEHTEIYINENRLISMNQVKNEKPSEVSNLEKGTFEIIVDEFDTLNEGFGDVIFVGGSDTNTNFINTFVVG